MIKKFRINIFKFMVFLIPLAFVLAFLRTPVAPALLGSEKTWIDWLFEKTFGGLMACTMLFLPLIALFVANDCSRERMLSSLKLKRNIRDIFMLLLLIFIAASSFVCTFFWFSHAYSRHKAEAQKWASEERDSSERAEYEAQEMSYYSKLATKMRGIAEEERKTFSNPSGRSLSNPELLERQARLHEAKAQQLSKRADWYRKLKEYHLHAWY